MMFCPKCGSILLPKKDGKATLLACSCGYTNKKATVGPIKEVIGDAKEIVAVDKEIEPYPLVQEECPKCGHEKAYFWEVQTRASDEPATKFFKCEKCRHTWRDYK